MTLHVMRRGTSGRRVGERVVGEWGERVVRG